MGASQHHRMQRASVETRRCDDGPNPDIRPRQRPPGSGRKLASEQQITSFSVPDTQDLGDTVERRRRSVALPAFKRPGVCPPIIEHVVCTFLSFEAANAGGCIEQHGPSA
jgi:hypothetical protein